MVGDPDPVGSMIDDITEMILEFRPTGRRRITSDENTARQLASEIVDFVCAYDAEQS